MDDALRLAELIEQHGIPAEGRYVLPEHVVKDLIADMGVAIPRRYQPSDLGASGAATPGGALVLKAWGPGLLHKSDLGAVRLGLAVGDVDAAIADMAGALHDKGVTPSGFLIEEQHPGGVELIVGVVRDETFGHQVLLGLGGVTTELLDLTALRPCPLSKTDAEELIDVFPGAPLLNGARGTAPVDRSALVELLLSIAGEDGLVSRFGSSLAEFECNPIVATPAGVTALDARMIVDPPPPQRERNEPDSDFTVLFAPRQIAVAGASTSKSSFGNRFLAAYRAAGWQQGLFAIHPTATEVDGVPAVPDVAQIPGGVDYLLVALPAKHAIGAVASAAGRVPFIQVISGGFGEMSSEGRGLEEELLTAATGSRLLGPNCLGVFSPAGRQTFSLGAPTTPGTVSVISQSGGLSGDIVAAGHHRGLRFAKLASIGNAIDVTHGELLDWLLDDPETEIIGVYLEGTRDGAGLLRALRRADGRKPVVVLRGGSGDQGARAVGSHTGSLATSVKVWEAVATSAGVTLVDTLEQFLGCLRFLQQCRTGNHGATPGVLVVGAGGGASVLSADACDRAGLTLASIDAKQREQLLAMGNGAGTSLANPLEIPIGPVSAPTLLGDTLAPFFATGTAPFDDVLVHLNAAAYYNYGSAGLAPLIDALRDLLTREFPARIAVVVRNADVATPEDAGSLASFAADTGLPIFHSFDEATVAISAAQLFDARRERL
ncbi:acetate--CoA ligase family protein [Nocardia jiangxiensis]|uniref:Acetate--CoA ligase family protein n=1 Tax=Nocardia jiangxiensis TaxID=282685 RepID=A0ABW6S1W3_9NOCA